MTALKTLKEPTTMSATAESLRELHELHQRAKAIRDRLTSEPKTVATRRAILDAKRAGVETAKKALQDERVQAKKRETLIQGQQTKSDDLKVKLNQVKKNDEYKAIQNQIAHEQASIAKLEDELLQAYEKIELQAKELGASEADLKKLELEVTELAEKIAASSVDHQAKLKELEAAVIAAEHIIPEDQRERYRRVVKQRSADALAAVENDACTGCYVSVTAQMKNELINAEAMVFCNTCGRILYLADESDHYAGSRQRQRA